MPARHKLCSCFSFLTRSSLLILYSTHMKVIGLFSGIGGIERGLKGAEFETELLCENGDAPRAVLQMRFPDAPLLGDVRSVKSLPRADVVTAGFPCQDLSQAGRTAGIEGKKSSLVQEVFRLLPFAQARWLLLENVPFMLHLDGGKAMSHLTDRLEAQGYRWAYRTIDARAFGVNQRRRRVVLLASQTEAPWDVLFADDVGPPKSSEPFSDNRTEVPEDMACGFYWTEGTRGLGWAVNAVPTIKGGSGLSIPSPPAVLHPSGVVGTPSLEDAEQLQGFPHGWTQTGSLKDGVRWRMVGNAVCVPMVTWVGQQLLAPGKYQPDDSPFTGKWLNAAYGDLRTRRCVRISAWPKRAPAPALAGELAQPMKKLSARALRGFLKRCSKGSLRFPKGFLERCRAALEDAEQDR